MIISYRFQNCAKLRDIPLAIVNFINQMPADILIKEMEDLKEGRARGNDTQVVVEHQKRVANSIDDGMRERRCVWNSSEWRSHQCGGNTKAASEFPQTHFNPSQPT